MILKNCTFFNEEFEKEFADIKIEQGRISEIGLFSEDGRDMSGLILLPGFTDIHIHGANGGDTADNSDASLDKMSSFLARHGVTSFCPSAMTNSIDSLCETAQTVRAYKGREVGAKIAGINLEGPFLSKEKCGSQKAEYIIPASKKAFDRLYSSGGGLIKLITVAPEASDNADFIEYASKKCTVSIGHTNADAAQCKTALKNGASHFTHLYNAMTPLHHRRAGAVGAALDSNATCELICDGVHICPEVLKTTFKVLGERAVTVSDSMRAAGLGEGEYELGGQKVYVDGRGDVARLDDGTIAASVTNLFDEFKNLLRFGIDFKTALMSCTINPAKVIKCDGEIGTIATGKAADFTIVDEKINLKGVIINGAFA